MHTWSSVNGGKLPLTAYVTWAMKECGRSDAFVMKGAEYVLANLHAASDPYILALCALALGDDFPVAMLEQHAVLEDGAARWVTEAEGLVHARGRTAAIEATAMAALALQRHRGASLADKALTALVRDKDPSGSWHSTQSTILAVKALLEGARGPRPAARDVNVKLFVNGREILGAFSAIGNDNAEVCQQAEIPVAAGETTVELETSGDVRATFQVAGRYYTLSPAPEAGPRDLEIATEYNRDDIALGEDVEATTTLTYRGRETFMVIADLGIPPGFDADPASFDALVKDRALDRYSLTGRQATLYFGRVSRGQQIVVRWTLRPRFPIRARTPRDRAFEYYTPQNEATGAARRIVVREKK
jgi:hypothetical protein